MRLCKSKLLISILMLFLPLLFFASLFSQSPDIKNPDIFAIEVQPTESKPFVFTDRATAFYFGETGKFNCGGHEGFYIGERKFLNDYLLLQAGNPVKRNEAKKVTVFFDRIRREYEDGFCEELALLDMENTLLIFLKKIPSGKIDFLPFSTDNFQRISVPESSLFLFTNNAEQTDEKIVVAVNGDCRLITCPEKMKRQEYIPGLPLCCLRLSGDNARIAVFTVTDKNEAVRKWNKIRNYFPNPLRKQEERITNLLNDCYFQSNDSLLNLGFYRALISLDQLIVHQKNDDRNSVGIFAGLPWFNNYWGRDTFISFAGAVLVTGRFDEAKEILRSFARYQNRNPESTDWGRIPNRVTGQEIIYNTADGTPWFVKALWDYYLYSGDRNFLREMFPAVELSVEGTMHYHCDSLGFLVHGDAETWMDAKGGQGAWSPRGNRAVEIQVLWSEQLTIASEIAKLLDKKVSQEKWRRISVELKKNIRKYFWDKFSGQLFDHLNADGSPDKKIRPNQIFALTIPSAPLLEPYQEISVLNKVVSHLTYPYGVASLWQHDADFHPYHQMAAFYPKDAAYHNGTVWTWLDGAVISAMKKYAYFDLAFSLLKSESDQILDVGAVGAYSELLDAIPRPGEKFPRWSGTVSQAWSLAEFVRNIYQDLLGIKPDIPHGEILWQPFFPAVLREVSFRIPLAKQKIFVSFKKTGNDLHTLKIDFIAGSRKLNFKIGYPLPDKSVAIFDIVIRPGESRTVQIFFGMGTNITVDGRKQECRFISKGEKFVLPKMTFAVPELDKELKALKPPQFPLLDGKTVTFFNPSAQTILDETDSLFDDHGPKNTYQYPTNSNFQAGILDLKRFQVSQDDENYYFVLEFRNLMQPGWHPEYGFQLTYAAIAITKEAATEGRKTIGRNANYNLPDGFFADRVIFIGGGLEIEDENGRIVAAYRPVDIRYPLGNTGRKTIRFAVPKKYLGSNAQNWKWAVLIGAQDDHGGAGIGEFREVSRKAGEWHGGGAAKESGNCNVYDFFICW